MIVEIIIILFVYVVGIVVATYYVDLFMTKDQYTKEELKDSIPFLKQLWNHVTTRFNIAYLAIIVLVSVCIGLILPFLSKSWVLKSSILYVVLFFLFPALKQYFEKAQVTSSDSYADNAVNIFVKFSNMIILGFGAGTGTALLYSWGAQNSINFLWFLLNIIVVTVMQIITIRSIAKNGKV